MIILLVATVISMVEWLLQDPRETDLPYTAIVIMIIVVLNALLGYFQEAPAERSVRVLMALAAPESTVIREGERQRIAADQIVPGDIVMVEAGDNIPADARVVENANLHTDEAPLTLNDWLIAAAVASTLLIASELVKIVLRIERRPVPGALAKTTAA